MKLMGPVAVLCTLWAFNGDNCLQQTLLPRAPWTISVVSCDRRPQFPCIMRFAVGGKWVRMGGVFMGGVQWLTCAWQATPLSSSVANYDTLPVRYVTRNKSASFMSSARNDSACVLLPSGVEKWKNRRIWIPSFFRQIAVSLFLTDISDTLSIDLKERLQYRWHGHFIILYLVIL
jgi:hypothetical protein